MCVSLLLLSNEGVHVVVDLVSIMYLSLLPPPPPPPPPPPSSPSPPTTTKLSGETATKLSSLDDDEPVLCLRGAAGVAGTRTTLLAGAAGAAGVAAPRQGIRSTLRFTT